MGRGHGRSSHSAHRSAVHRSTAHRSTTHRPARRTTITHKRKTNHFSSSSRRRHHHYSTGGTTIATEGGDDIVYIESEAPPPWIKEQYKVPIIVLSVFLAVCCVLFILLMSLLPTYTGDVCNGIKNVSIGNVEYCTPDFFSSFNDAYFYSESKDVTAYLFRSTYAPYTNPSNMTFEYEETVLPDKFTVYSIEWNYHGVEAYFHYKLSGEAAVFVMTSEQLQNLWETGTIVSFVRSFVSVREAECYLTLSNTLHIVIYNSGSKKVTAKETGWIYAYRSYVNEGAADVICRGGAGGCIFDHLSTKSNILIVHEGHQRTVPVTILLNYKFNEGLIPVMIILPLGIIIFSFLLLGCCCSRRNAPDELPPPTEEKAEQVITPDGVGDPQTTPGGVTPGSAIDAPPTVGQDAASMNGMPPTDPSMAPADPSLAPTDPSLANAPNPGQPVNAYGQETDIYVIPLNAV